MKKKSKISANDELRPEYKNLRQLLKNGVRGKYTERYRSGTNLILLEPDVASVFPNAQAVNEALRLAIQIAKLQSPPKRKAIKTL
ncbi:MAG: hypothetical protein HZB52_09325 [Chloroflexi bacterium]|nr:hypothetical protein [Chloroflexota bacterium]